MAHNERMYDVFLGVNMNAIFNAQRAWFHQNMVVPYAARIDALNKLEQMVLAHEADFIAVLHQDFGRRATQETQLLELVPLLSEIRHCKRHLKRWMRPKKVSVDWYFLPARAKVIYQPLGVIGIMGAWNYPVSLVLTPLVDALAAGNCAVIKPSELAPATSALIARLIGETFDARQVAVVEGGADVAAAFAALPFDHLIFTGSGRIGKKVMAAAVENLTPVTLELGGKSPVIIHESYDLDDAADKIITTKLWNAGQTCIAPDYVLVAEAQRDALERAIERVLHARFADVVANTQYSHMINAPAWRRMNDIVADAAQLGARVQAYNPKNERADEASGVFLPTILWDVTDGMRAMREELFGPILPIMTYQTVDEAIAYVNAHDRPLALYYFDHNARRADDVLARTRAGGAVINDCVWHYAQHHLPFGGVGGSGMGAYHGHTGFLSLSTQTGVFMQSRILSMVLKRLTKPPYTVWTQRLLRVLMGK
jgi:coniferyl-aldehyde dehydrogenase